MKFRVERDVFADAVAWAARSLPVRPSAPVLAGLLIEASAEGLVLSAFDYETSARAELRADVDSDGRVLVSGRLLADICRSLPQKPIDFELTGPKLELKCGSGRFSLQTMPVEDYPTLPSVPPASGVVSGDEFANAVAQAVTAAGRDDMLPVLTGVRIEIEGERMSLLATDRFRLSHRELTWRPANTDSSLAALVPAKVLSDTAKNLNGDVTISISPAGGDGIIGFEGSSPDGLRRTTTRLLDGDFPKVRSLFPSEHLTVATVNKSELIDTVKRVALVAERNTAVQMKFGDGEIILDSQSGDEAQATEAVSAEITGDEIVTGFNPAYLLDGLSALAGEKIDLSFTQANKPVVISSTDASDSNAFRYLLMPRRLLS
ncbi:DNA polymerase III subunit beta [Nocardioides gilvus]|uniref:DNA polymerase III subunit beta n=1 Tax=Nocardioides gilvus TaxID=1735589 RepID=UPI000D747D1A|nr:DNA polymerase III subunit beta [Nocardioides gilvus]